MGVSARVWVKSHLADKALSPVRDELIGLVEHGSCLLDVGCGTGDFLFKSAAKLSKGLGVDIDTDMIKYADRKRRSEGIENLSFVCGGIGEVEKEKFDIATSTLCLHEMGERAACEMLELMVSNSKKVLVADYVVASTMLGRLGIEVDEMFSGHYGKFRRYMKSGAMPYYAGRVGVDIKGVVKTKIDGISIWIMDGKL